MKDTDKDTKLDKTEKKPNGKRGKGKAFKGSRAKDFNPRKGESCNDPSWYSLNKTLTDQLANIPFSQYIGINYNTVATALTTENQTVKVFNEGRTAGRLPSVMMSTYIPWYGKAETASDALSLATRAFYQFVRHANSGAKNYEAPDLMMYIMAMDNIYLAIAEIKRVLKLANTYYLQNRSIPDSIIKIMGINPVDLRKNYIHYVSQLNIMIARVNTMSVPGDFKLFLRRAVLGMAIMTDDVDAPTQLSFYNARGYYKYNFLKTDVSQASALVLVDKRPYNTDQLNGTNFQFNSQPLSEWLRILEELIQAVVEDEDLNIISGDILKAYGENTYRVSLAEVNDTQEFAYDVNMLQQFKNTIYLDCPQGDITDTLQWITYKDGVQKINTVPTIAQDGGLLKASVRLNTSGSNYQEVLMGGLIEAMRTNISMSCVHKPSSEEVMEWSRNMITVDEKTLSITAGTEIFTDLLLAVPDNTCLRNHTGGQVFAQYVQHHNVYCDPALTPSYLGMDFGDCTVIIEKGYSPANNDIYLGYGNSYWATAMVSGLDYGPSTFYYGTHDQTTMPLPAGSSGIYLDLTPIYGNVKTNNALCSKANINSWHDYALTCLLFSQFIKS